MKGEKDLLIELARTRKAPFGKRIVHVFSSWAKGSLDKFDETAQKVATEIERALVTGTGVGVYSLPNGDIVFTYCQVSTASVLTVCSRIEKMIFGDQAPQRNPYGEINYYKIVDAGKDINRVIDVVKTILHQAQPQQVVGGGKPPIGIKQFDSIITTVRKSDIRPIVFNQPVYFIDHNKPSIEYLEFFTSIAKLEQMICPDHSIAAEPSLFNMIKKDLDSALMRMIGREIPEYRHKAFGLNVLVTTFLAPEFDVFMEKVPARLSGKIYVELDRADFLQHSGELDKLDKRSRALNVPICIDGLSHHDMRLMRLSSISSAFTKVKWSEDVFTMPREDIDSFVRDIKGCRDSHVVLTRCDSPRSLSFARAIGIRFVQGRLVDKLFRAGMEIGGSSGDDPPQSAAEPRPRAATLSRPALAAAI